MYRKICLPEKRPKNSMGSSPLLLSVKRRENIGQQILVVVTPENPGQYLGLMHQKNSVRWTNDVNIYWGQISHKNQCISAWVATVSVKKTNKAQLIIISLVHRIFKDYRTFAENNKYGLLGHFDPISRLLHRKDWKWVNKHHFRQFSGWTGDIWSSHCDKQYQRRLPASLPEIEREIRYYLVRPRSTQQRNQILAIFSVHCDDGQEIKFNKFQHESCRFEFSCSRSFPPHFWNWCAFAI